MYINVALVDEKNPNIEDLSVPLLINNCGYYRLHTTPIIGTPHPEGRNDYQLLYIAAGKGHFFFKGSKKRTVVAKGNIILFRPGEPQIYYYYAKDKTEVFWVHFTGSEVEELLEQYGLTRDKNVFFAGFSHDFPWHFSQMIRELQNQRINYMDIANLHLYTLFATIDRSIRESKKATNDTMNEIDKAVQFFNAHYYNPISVEEYAQKHMISTNWFIHSFKEVMKMSPLQYIISVRITNAKDYLANTSLSIADISNNVGYTDAMYFSRLFKKYTGMTPSEYRKKHKTSKDSYTDIK